MTVLDQQEKLINLLLLTLLLAGVLFYEIFGHWLDDLWESVWKKGLSSCLLLPDDIEECSPHHWISP